MEKLDLKDFDSKKPEIKYCAAKKAIKISEEHPQKLYQSFDFFVKFLDGENNVLRWTAIIVLGNLAKVDRKGKIDKVLDRLAANVKEDSLITAGNSIKTMGKIGRYKPKYQERMLHAILAVEKANFLSKGKPSPECRNVAIGHALDAIKDFDQKLLKQKEAIGFIRRQAKNSRPTVQRRAKKMLLHYGR